MYKQQNVLALFTIKLPITPFELFMGLFVVVSILVTIINVYDNSKDDDEKIKIA